MCVIEEAPRMTSHLLRRNKAREFRFQARSPLNSHLRRNKVELEALTPKR